jgi:hypothetical protein
MNLGMLVLLLLLAGCAGSASPPSGQARADAETVAACRERAEQVYDIRHRGDIYSPPPQVDTPFSSNYAPGTPDQTLAALHEHDELINDCVRNTGTETNRSNQ